MFVSFDKEALDENKQDRELKTSIFGIIIIAYLCFNELNEIYKKEIYILKNK
jgi:hypothetical protein